MKKCIQLLFHFPPKKIGMTLCVTLCIMHGAFSQVGQWTWMGGDSVSRKEAVYGIQGVPSILNHPPTVYEGCEWTDNSGNFWFYGGIHQDSLGMNVTYGDLWKFNPSTLEWTWMNGPGIPSQLAVYGTLRIPAAGNYPGAKCFGPIGITDHNGIFWMYGGYENDNSIFYSDLWSYDPSTNLWTWMSGQTTNLYMGTFGVKGVPSPLNYPPSKQECNAGWADASNNIWIFGGQIPMGSGNDLWKFDVVTFEWTWMKGDSVGNGSGIYGVREIPDPANTPGGRNVYSKWTDSDSNFWLFGGAGMGGAQNDIWRYEVGSNQWTWMNGSSTPGSGGFADSLCHYSPLYAPPSRSENRTAWKDSCDIMYAYGGFGQSDLWSYNRFTNEWSKLFDSPNAPSFGIKGVSSASNRPGDKGGSSAWIDGYQNLWLYGGITGGLGYMGDLWCYVTDPVCRGCVQSVPTAIFNSPDNVICPGTCTDFINLSLQGTSYQWFFPSGNPSVSTDINPQGICYNIPGTYPVTLIATNATGSDTLTLNNFITVFPQPAPQGISQSGDTLFANQGATSYQWYYNGNIINGATDYFYVATQSGDYNVVATDENNCEVEAVINNVMAAVGNSSMQSIQIYPNPVHDEFTIQKLQVTSGTAAEISIYNVLGEKVYSGIYSDHSIIDCSHFPQGLYLVELSSSEKILRGKFVKQ